MARYVVRRVVDASTRRPLPSESAVFVRRVRPESDRVHRVYTGPGGRLENSVVVGPGVRVFVGTGELEVTVSDHYLAVWLPASELSSPSDFDRQLAGLRSDPRYLFKPGPEDARSRQLQAERLPGHGAGPTPTLPPRLLSILSDLNMSALAPQLILATPEARHETLARLIELLEEVQEIEESGQVTFAAHDEAMQFRGRIETSNGRYRRAGGRERVRMLQDWRRELAEMATQL